MPGAPEPDAHALPTTGQQVTVVVVSGEDALVTPAEVLVSDEDSIVVEVRGSKSPPSRGDRVTLLYSVGEGVMRLKTRCLEVYRESRWILEADAPPVPGERRDYYRADVEVGVAVVRDLPADREAARADLRRRADRLPIGDLPRLAADLSGSGMRFAPPEPLGDGSTVGLLIALDPSHGPIYGVEANVLRTGQDGRVALTFEQPSPALQEAVVTAVFRQRYGALMGERRDFYRATMTVGMQVLGDVPADEAAALDAVRDAATSTDPSSLAQVEVNLSGSGLRFVPDEPLGEGDRIGLLLRVRADAGPVYGALADVVGQRGEGTACTFHHIPADLQDDIVTAVLAASYEQESATASGLT